MGKNKEEEEKIDEFGFISSKNTGSSFDTYYERILHKYNPRGFSSYTEGADPVAENPLLDSVDIEAPKESSVKTKVSDLSYYENIQKGYDLHNYVSYGEGNKVTSSIAQDMADYELYRSVQVEKTKIAMENKPQKKSSGFKSTPDNIYKQTYARPTARNIIFGTDISSKEYSTKGLSDSDMSENQVVNNQLIDENSSYRAFLTKDRQSIIYVSCPKTWTGNTEDVLNHLDRGDKGFIQLTSIPSHRTSVNKPVKQQIRLEDIREAVAKKPKSVYTKEQFYKNTDKVVTFRTGSLYNGDAYSMSVQNFQSGINSDNKTCPKNVPCSFNSQDGGKFYVGFTTGRFVSSTSSVEVVCANMLRDNMHGDLSYGSGYIKMEVNYRELNILTSKYHSDAYRVKVISSDQSGILFGFKSMKKKMHDQVFTPDQFKVVRSYYCKKLDSSVDVVEIKGEDGRYIKFLMSELEFLTIDPSKVGMSVGKKSILIGSVVRVVDDRKIKLDKNQQLIVTNIKKSTSGVKNSYVTLKDTSGNTHGVLLKQIKAV